MRFGSVQYNKKLMVVLAIFSLFLPLLILLNIIPLDDIIENMRYFLSAAAQSFAALIALILVIYNVTKSKIPNYEHIFGETYQKMLEKYYEIKKIKYFIFMFGLAILYFLVALLFISNNRYVMSCIAGFSGFVFGCILLDFLTFFTNNLIKSGKDKFFDDASYVIQNKLNHDELYELAENIHKYYKKTISEHIELEYFDRDDEKVVKLYTQIILKYGRLLLNKKVMGDTAFYQYFGKIVEWSFEFDSSLHLVNPPVIHHEISQNFIKHVEMCIKDGHCSKYIPDVLKLVVKLIDMFNRQGRNNLRDEYMKIYEDIYPKIQKLEYPCEIYKILLKDISKSFVETGLYNY